MLNYRLGTVNEKHWGFKPVFRCSKPQHKKHIRHKSHHILNTYEHYVKLINKLLMMNV